MSQVISGLTLDAERALYNLKNAEVRSCTFAGPADGESALKEARGITVENCRFSLRYPLWHIRDFIVKDSEMDEKTRAALWYAFDGKIERSVLGGVKAMRECGNISLSGCRVVSAEFGWKCKDITAVNCDITAEYLFFESRNVRMSGGTVHGKYSFQYVEDLVIENADLDTKDAFWHSKNVTVRNSIVKGEYLGWFSEGLTLVGCKIIGTQPLCYCKNLKLIDCTMENCDLSFEYSDVEADVRGHIDSVKNPLSGVIVADSVGEVIRGDAVYDCCGKVILSNGEIL